MAKELSIDLKSKKKEHKDKKIKKEKKEKKDKKDKKEKAEVKPKVAVKKSEPDDDSSSFCSDGEVETKQKPAVAKTKAVEAVKQAWSAKQVFVSGLPYETTEDQLKEFFKDEVEKIG